MMVDLEELARRHEPATNSKLASGALNDGHSEAPRH
jgi:hypothetical protein